MNKQRQSGEGSFLGAQHSEGERSESEQSGAPKNAARSTLHSSAVSERTGRCRFTEQIPKNVAADKAYKNAKKHSDRQNARIEHDKALARAMNDVLKDDTELFKQFCDNDSFRKWLSDSVFSMTYDESKQPNIP